MNFISTFIIGVLFIIGILLIIWSISLKCKSRYLINKCTEKCEGIIIKLNEIEIDQHTYSGGRWFKTKSYVPIYEYEVQKEKYKIKGTNGSGFKIGDIASINYNPENPKECYIDGYSFNAWIVPLIIGIICIIMTSFFGLLIKLIFG